MVGRPARFPVTAAAWDGTTGAREGVVADGGGRVAENTDPGTGLLAHRIEA